MDPPPFSNGKGWWKASKVSREGWCCCWGTSKGSDYLWGLNLFVLKSIKKKKSPRQQKQLQIGKSRIISPEIQSAWRTLQLSPARGGLCGEGQPVEPPSHLGGMVLVTRGDQSACSIATSLGGSWRCRVTENNPLPLPMWLGWTPAPCRQPEQLLQLDEPPWEDTHPGLVGTPRAKPLWFCHPAW